ELRIWNLEFVVPLSRRLSACSRDREFLIPNSKFLIMVLLLVHHGDAVGPEVDSRRPLSAEGSAGVERVAAQAAARGAKPDVVWHSGKLRAKQTAEAVWRACNALAELSATRDLQPDDPPQWIRDRLRGETRDIAIVGHFPHLP